MSEVRPALFAAATDKTASLDTRTEVIYIVMFNTFFDIFFPVIWRL